MGHLKILAYQYAVEQSGLADDIGALGRCHMRRLRIQLAEDMPPAQIASTLLHEVLEALNYHMELGIDHSSIMALEAGLYQVLTENGVDLGPLVQAAGCGDVRLKRIGASNG